MQQTDAYGNPPNNVLKGSWLARVSHRASHIPANKALNLQQQQQLTHQPQQQPPPANSSALPATTGPPRPGSEASISSTLSLPGTGLARPLLLQAPETSGFASQLELQLSAVQEANSYPESLSSPTETEFAGATPIDASFGDRVEPSVPPEFADRLRSRSNTASKIDKALPTSPELNTHTEGLEERMDKYARQAGDQTYDSDAEADDEFERSVFTSPVVAGEYDDQSDHPSESEDDVSVADGEDTPTTQGWTERDGRSPIGKVAQWTEEEVADYMAALSPALEQYGQRFVEEGVNGEALIALNHEELKELGVVSVGHRLTILKAVYEQKVRSGVKIEEGDYVPLSAEGEKAEMNATQDDITRIIDSLRLRDQRIIAAEADLRILKADLDRITEENKKLREETLPIMRLVKDQRTPLPDPVGGTIPSPREAEHHVSHGKASSLSRKFSTKKLFLKSDGSKQPSPTHPPQSNTPQPREVRDDGGTHLEASAAAMAASTHLTASMTAQTSPNSVHGQQLSPTSPAYSTTGPPTGGSYHQPGSAAARSFPIQNQRSHGHDHDTQYANSHYSSASTIVAEAPQSARVQQDRSRRQAPTPSPREEESGRERDNPQVEIFKSFRVSIDDPCRVVLPVALKRYNITDDWRQYALYIVHGDQERCLGLEEKPLLLFKQLDKEGRKPMFMLRRHASPQEGWSGAAGGGVPPGHQDAKQQVPGGVL